MPPNAGISPQTISTRSLCRVVDRTDPHRSTGKTGWPGLCTRARPPEKNSERLVAQNHKRGDRNERQLGDDRADREQPDFTFALRVHVSPNA
jgi:hypothetical protein